MSRHFFKHFFLSLKTSLACVAMATSVSALSPKAHAAPFKLVSGAVTVRSNEDKAYVFLRNPQTVALVCNVKIEAVVQGSNGTESRVFSDPVDDFTLQPNMEREQIFDFSKAMTRIRDRSQDRFQRLVRIDTSTLTADCTAPGTTPVDPQPAPTDLPRYSCNDQPFTCVAVVREDGSGICPRKVLAGHVLKDRLERITLDLAWFVEPKTTDLTEDTSGAPLGGSALLAPRYKNCSGRAEFRLPLTGFSPDDGSARYLLISMRFQEGYVAFEYNFNSGSLVKWSVFEGQSIVFIGE